MIKEYRLTVPQNNFICTIPFKGCKVEAKFEHGNVAKGINAKLTTNDPFVQRAVEASDMYGKLFVLSGTVKEPGDDAVPTKKTTPAKTTATPAKGGGKGAGKKNEPKPEPTPEPAADGDDGNKMEFQSVADAIVYINTTYGEEIHTKPEAIAYLEGQGIKATIIE